MKHAREDYNRIQDPAGLIPEDEPVFLLRGQDIFAPDCLLLWAKKVIEHGKAEPDRDKKAGLAHMALLAMEQAMKMRDWQVHTKAKIPDYNPDAKVAYIPGQRKEPQP